MSGGLVVLGHHGEVRMTYPMGDTPLCDWYRLAAGSILTFISS